METKSYEQFSFRGPPGEKGDTPKLETFDRGPETIVGPYGIQGDIGDKGDRGFDGRDGSPGEPGNGNYLFSMKFLLKQSFLTILGLAGIRGDNGEKGLPGQPGLRVRRGDRSLKNK